MCDGQTVYWTQTLSYDASDRPLVVQTPDEEASGGIVQTGYAYAGLVTTVTDAKGRRTRTTKNSEGWVMSVERNIDAGTSASDYSAVSYDHDALGQVTTTTVGSLTTSIDYDVRGRKQTMSDPDMGVWNYRYNAFGELIWQQDAKNQIVTMSYDALGRMTSRTETEGTTNWSYDSPWVGKLTSVSRPSSASSPGYSESYTYDSYLRPQTISRVIDGTTYNTTTTYDGYGRPQNLVYPTGFQTKNVYNAFGFVKDVRRADSGKTDLYWEADHYSADGRIDGEVYGNGLIGDRVYSKATGRLRYAAIDIGTAVGDPSQSHSTPYSIQDLYYSYDAVGNVIVRQDGPGSRNETFGYDGLDRLTTHALNGASDPSVQYDQLGNITYKPGVGNYAYAFTPAERTGPLPHAVSQAGSNYYSYDANGNMTAGAGRSITWTSFNQVLHVSGPGGSSDFTFDAAHQRVKQTANWGTTIYVGSAFERVTKGSAVENVHYIFAPTGRVAVYTERSDNSKDVRFLHSDGLGSVTAVTDEYGAILQRFSYDPWGKRTTTNQQVTDAPATSQNNGGFRRGFTDHEHLDDLGLIHMNGRVYDPVLGRFLSADPYVGDNYDSQDYNRYSYLGNNPLGGTDPSGYFSLKDAVKIVAIVAIGIVTAGAAVYGAALASGMTGITFGGALAATLGVSSTYSLTLAGAIIAGGAGGFASGFAGSLLNGGSIGDAFKAGVIGGAIGAVTGGLTHGIGTASEANDWGWFETAAAHGVVEGAANEAVGGQFRHGFYAGFFSSAAEGPISTYVPNEAGYRVVASAVVGGTSSTLGGGKFANGAVSGAFVYMFNKAAHQAAQKSVAWVYVEADHPEIAAGDDASVAKDMREQSAWLKKDMQVDDRNTSRNPFKKSTNYLSDGDRFDAFVVKQGDNYATLRQQLKGYDRVYVLIHGTTQGTEQLFYFNGMKVNEAGLRRMIPNMTEQYGCRIVSGTTTSAKFYEKYIPITRDYLRN